MQCWVIRSALFLYNYNNKCLIVFFNYVIQSKNIKFMALRIDLVIYILLIKWLNLDFKIIALINNYALY